jgi:dTMP kinase
MGNLFVFEGPDRVGKTEISNRVSREIGAEKFSFPGNKDGSLGSLIYNIHHDKEKHGVDSIHPVSLQVLHISAHIDLIEDSIKPSISNDGSVILDRFWWSTLIYGRNNNIDYKSLNAMIDLEKLHWEDTRPDILFLIDRPRPFGQKTDDWEDLRSLYLSFANERNHPYPVEIVKNTSSIEDAVDDVLDAIEQFEG